MAKRGEPSRQAKSPSKKSKREKVFGSIDGNDTDVLFLIEGKKLYFNKAILRACSPGFKTMFSNDYTEGDVETIHLLGKKYADMESFFKLIHPKYSAAEHVTDKTIRQIYRLAAEYEADSVRKKCKQYIEHQMQQSLPNDRLLFYLAICDEHSLIPMRAQLLEHLTKKKMTDLKKSRFYGKVPQAAMKDLAVQRSLELESIIETVRPVLDKMLSNSDCLCAQGHCPDKQKCDDSGDFTAICQRCAKRKLEKIGNLLE